MSVGVAVVDVHSHLGVSFHEESGQGQALVGVGELHSSCAFDFSHFRAFHHSIVGIDYGKSGERSRTVVKTAIVSLHVLERRHFGRQICGCERVGCRNFAHIRAVEAFKQCVEAVFRLARQAVEAHRHFFAGTQCGGECRSLHLVGCRSGFR